MKIDARGIAAFLRDPGSCRVVLLFGGDNGLIRERSDSLVRAVAGALDDPFRVSEIDRDGVGRIAEEAHAVPMTGGRRVVRVREVTDVAATVVQALLASRAAALLVLEAGELTGKSRLRALTDSTADAASIACYPEQGADLAASIRAVLASSGLEAQPEATAYLCEHLGSDRGATRRELERLALFVHPRTVVTLDDAMLMVGDLAGLILDDALYAATEGDVQQADRALELAFGEGTAPVSVIRQLLMHLQKLERIGVSMRQGHSASEAVRALRPPVFFRRQDALVRAAALWNDRALAGASDAAWNAELACKRTGSPAAVLCRQALLNVARRAAARRTG